MAGMTDGQKRAMLARMSYQDYLLNVAKMTPEVLPFLYWKWRTEQQAGGYYSSSQSAERGSAGFNGLGLKFAGGFQRRLFYVSLSGWERFGRASARGQVDSRGAAWQAVDEYNRSGATGL